MSKKKFTLDAGTGSLGNAIYLSNKELKSLQEFKTRIQDVAKPHHEDRYFLKWLKARNMDVNKSEQMFRTSMSYREKMKVDTLAETYTPPEVLEKYLPGGFCGYDKEGSPVLIELYGYADMKGILHSCKKSDIEKIKLLMGEYVMKDLEKQSKKFDKPVDGMTVIIDMDKVGTSMLWGPGLAMYAHMGKVLQDNYPEVVKKTFLVNTPRMFPMLWRMIRPLVTEEMKRKVSILGGDFKSELLKCISPDQLPAFLGGDMRDPDGDPRCPSKICQGGRVPEDYYLTDNSLSQDMEKATVGRGDKLELRYYVPEAGSMIRWEFKTDGYDIGFGLYYEGLSGAEEEMATERVNSHMVPEDGTHLCNKPGNYLVLFDNSYSWTRTKTVYYNIDVLPPDDKVIKDLDSMAQDGSWERVAEETEVTKL